MLKSRILDRWVETFLDEDDERARASMSSSKARRSVGKFSSIFAMMWIYSVHSLQFSEAGDVSDPQCGVHDVMVFFCFGSVQQLNQQKESELQQRMMSLWSSRFQLCMWRRDLTMVICTQTHTVIKAV